MGMFSCCSWTSIIVGTSVNGIHVLANCLWWLTTSTAYEVFVGANPTERDLSQWAPVPVESTLWECRLWGYVIVLYCGLKHDSRYVGSVNSWSSFGKRQYFLLPVTGLGLPGKSYKAILRWSWSVLDLMACWRGHFVNWGWLLSVLLLGKFN